MASSGPAHGYRRSLHMKYVGFYFGPFSTLSSTATVYFSQRIVPPPGNEARRGFGSNWSLGAETSSAHPITVPCEDRADNFIERQTTEKPCSRTTRAYHATLVRQQPPRVSLDLRGGGGGPPGTFDILSGQSLQWTLSAASRRSLSGVTRSEEQCLAASELQVDATSGLHRSITRLCTESGHVDMHA